ncbi:MAG: aminotransferase class V-fold PLP-dependent enzyme [Rhizomicrobium sp.]
MTLARRDFLMAGLAFDLLGQSAYAHGSSVTKQTVPSFSDEAYWAKISALYDVTRDVVQLENGNYGTMARSVAKAYAGYLDRVNCLGSYYTRREFLPEYLRVRQRVAANLGVSPDEIALTRGATESLMTLIGGYNKLKPGDAVLVADHDYDSTIAAFEHLQNRHSIAVVKITLPEPASYQGLIDAYDAALKANPHIRLMLLTHVSHRDGLVLPVKEIARLAKVRGVDVLLDSAHAWGQLDFTLPELGVDFIGLTCQKWIGAPLGVGVLYIRKDRIADIDPALGNDGPGNGIESRVHTGTWNFAAYMAIEDALNVHEAIGAAAKEARLRYLRDRWAEALRDRVEVLTPADPRLTCGITSFRLTGRVSPVENKTLADELLKRFRIFTVDRSGLASGACVRVTPAVFTTYSEIDCLIGAIRTLV